MCDSPSEVLHLDFDMPFRGIRHGRNEHEKQDGISLNKKRKITFEKTTYCIFLGFTDASPVVVFEQKNTPPRKTHKTTH
jgi:hypothetical protein